MHNPLGRQIIRFQSVTSTNDIAWQHASDPNNHGLIVVADEQTQGRGQRGNTWLGPSGSSLLLSVLLFPPEEISKPARLTLWAALGVCDVIAELIHKQPLLKWPNDILLEAKKVAGVLVEMRAGAVVVGVGVNISTSQETFQKSGLFHAASLSHFTHQPLDRERVLHNLLDHWDKSYQQLSQDKNDGLVDAWRRYSNLEGATVEITLLDSAIKGIVRNLALDNIQLETTRGSENYPPESIRSMTILS